MAGRRTMTVAGPGRRAGAAARGSEERPAGARATGSAPSVAAFASASQCQCLVINQKDILRNALYRTS